MLALLPVLLTTPTLAAAPLFGLCDGATTEEWHAMAGVHGLQVVDFPTAAAMLAANDPRALVYCRALPEDWELRSLGADGMTRAVRAPRPATPADRERVVQYALLVLGTANPAARAAADEAAQLATAPPLPSPAPEPTPAPAPSPPPMTLDSAPPPIAASTVSEAATLVASARRPAPWVGVGPGATWRPETTPGATIDFAGGVRLAGRYWIGADTSLHPTRDVTADGDANGLQDFALALRAAWSRGVTADGHTPRVAPLLGVGGGFNSHAWYDAGEALGATIAPIVAGDVGLSVRMLEERDHLTFVPLARVTMDLGTTQTIGEHAVPVALIPVQVELLLTFRTVVPGMP